MQGFPNFDKAALEAIQDQAFRDAAAEHGLTWAEAESIVENYKVETAKLTKKFQAGQIHLSKQLQQRFESVASRKQRPAENSANRRT